ncbi:MAG: hypothetical protein KDA41_12735, partial [Planctomycetales bacterium]|nr:hypothetical protein [Planctomycetales bacterium]
QGKLLASPRILLSQSPAVMTLDRGPLLEQVALTPDICRSLLKYVAPMVADATRCDGSISASVNQFALPIDAPQAGTIDGALTVHAANVRPGLTAMHYVNLAQQVQSVFRGQPLEPAATGGELSLIQFEQQQVAVSMQQGRVHHRGLKMKIGDVTLITSGSVGVDQTLDLVAEIPIEESWVAQRRLLGAMSGQTIKIPIRGTIGRPAFDASALEQLGRQLVTGTATRLLDREVNRLLDGLVKPPSGPARSEGLPPPQEPPAALPIPELSPLKPVEPTP